MSKPRIGAAARRGMEQLAERDPVLFELLQREDYAGLFPPAGLDMPTAVRAYDGYRNGEHAWMLGAFVVPASRLGELAAAVEGTGASGAWPISLLVSSFDEGVAVLGGARGRWHVRALELTPQEPGKVRAGNGGVQLFYEVPLDDGVDARLDAITRAAAAAKVRTGGIEARAFPTAERLAHFIHGCVERDLPFKATAGLHHPLRGRYALTYERASAHGEMFGFLEVALVAGLLGLRRIDTREATALLGERRSDVVLTPDALEWAGHRLAIDEIVEARRGQFRSFGSCSFEEPVAELARLGLLL
jgi:hypothetical protein